MSNQKHIVIAAGGSGGHIIPAEKIGRVLKRECKISYVAVAIEENPYFTDRKERMHSIEGSNFSRGILKGALQIIKGAFSAKRYLQKEKVDHVIGFGSYHSFPTLLAAKWLKIPFTLFEPNLHPGRVNRFFSKAAKSSFIYFPPSQEKLKGLSKLIHFDLSLDEEVITEKEARKKLGLEEDLPTILVFGGSQGAKTINKTFLDTLSSITKPFQVIHFGVEEKDCIKWYREQKILAHVHPFSKEMHIAWSACDFAISRAGAGTIVEQVIYEKPAILIPYPHAKDDHQMQNAKYMKSVVGGAEIIEQSELTKDRLALEIEHFLALDRQKLRSLTNAIHAYKTKHQRPHIGTCLREFL